MGNEEQDTIAVLNDLIATCKDGVSGFKSAANAVQNLTLKALLTSRVVSIEQAASDLQEAVRALGGDPTDFGHPAESLHRSWINMKAALDGSDEHEVLEETARGEEAAVSHYREALQRTTLPDAIRGLVARQLRGAQENLAAVRAVLTDPAAPASARAASSFDVRP
jgi:uncharacterized protein (TIGR02284 family)